MSHITTPAGEASGLSAQDLAYLETAFRHHPPAGDQLDRYATVRAHALSMATAVLLSCPPSRERALALSHLETAMFWANASIARSGT